MNVQWLLLIYKTPSGVPSAGRVAIWRKLKALGAVYFQNGACLLPTSDEHRRTLKIIENDITEMGGECFLLQAGPFDEQQQKKVVARFNADRDEAYTEFRERCEAFEHEIARESEAGKFTYAELEENEEDLKKLKTWLAKIKALDFYKASKGAESEDHLARCDALLDRFAHEVFDAQQSEPSENSGDTGARE